LGIGSGLGREPRSRAGLRGDRACPSAGLCREIREIESIAAQAGIPLVVDSAAAFGGEDDRGEAAGAAGDLEVFSFHATKPFAVGEGGAVLAPPAQADRIRRTRRVGERSRRLLALERRMRKQSA
jgi:dTDP-4-amino-4,6-dideoxygalactose transaminase